MAPFALAAVFLVQVLLASTAAAQASWTCAAAATVCPTGSACVGLTVNPGGGYNSFSVQACSSNGGYSSGGKCASFSNLPYGGLGLGATVSLTSCTIGPTACAASSTCSANFLQMSAAYNLGTVPGGIYNAATGNTIPVCAEYSYSNGGTVVSDYACVADMYASASSPNSTCNPTSISAARIAFAKQGYTNIQIGCTINGAAAIAGAAVAVIAAIFAASLAL